jgi:DnaD/phage-associated family protein
MDKQIEATISKFTPCPDALVEKYSHTTALVWGKVWRYCQMKDEMCRAAIKRLADDLGLTDDTIAKHIKLLEKGGYIKDLTPDVRHKPHEYVDTGKLKLRINLFMEEETGTENLGTNGYRKNRVKESSSGSGNATDIFSVYQNNIGMLTSMMADTLTDAEKTYPKEWIVEAISLAVENNKRSWRYCETILKRWEREGKDAGKDKPAPIRPEHLPVQAEDKSQYVPRPNHIPRPNIRPAAITGD